VSGADSSLSTSHGIQPVDTVRERDEHDQVDDVQFEKLGGCHLTESTEESERSKSDAENHRRSEDHHDRDSDLE
jgi:hypothetical protein